MSRREKRKFKKLILMLGLGGCIMASGVAAMVMAYSPRLANWTLPAQAIADAASPLPVTKPGWSGRIPPSVLPLGDGSQGLQSRASGAQPGDVATIPTKADTDSSSLGSSNPDPQELPQGSADGSSASVLAMASSAGSMGGSSSWPGTINPNPTSFRSLSFPSVSGGSPGGGGPVGPSNQADHCATPEAKGKPECQPGKKPDAEVSPPKDSKPPEDKTAHDCPENSIANATGCEPAEGADHQPNDDPQNNNDGPSSGDQPGDNSSVNSPPDNPGGGTSPGDTANNCPSGQTCAPICPNGSVWNGTECAVQTVADNGSDPDQGIHNHPNDPNCDGANCSTHDPAPVLVPEPASLALILAGLAGIGLTVRRRR